MLRLILILSFASLCSTISWGQTVGRHYWTKTVLATNSTCKLRIGYGSFSPGESNCSYTGHIAANTKILLKSVTSSGGWRKLDLLDEHGKTFSIEISHRNKTLYEQIFGDFFGERAGDDYEPTCKGKVLKDFLFSVGFPDQLSRKAKTEEWNLSPNHLSVQSCGFDMANLKFVEGNLESITGSI